MLTTELQAFLHQQIPLSQALGVAVQRADDASAEVSAPLAPNSNHLGTAFGGSLSALLILSGYTWLFRAMSVRGHKCHVVLKRSEVDYVKPVTSSIIATATAPSEKEFDMFLKTFEKKGIGRVNISATISDSNSSIAARLLGEFVATPATESHLG